MPYVHRLCPPLHFFFTDTATTETYTLSLHDALPIYFDHQHLAVGRAHRELDVATARLDADLADDRDGRVPHPLVLAIRSEEHTSELQSRENLVCRLLLEKKKIRRDINSALPTSSEKQ